MDSRVLRRVVLLLVTLATTIPAAGDYLVLVDAGPDGGYRPAAEAMAKLHDGVVRRFDPADLDAVFRVFRSAPPRFVVFVLPPHKIDVDLVHAILELAVKVAVEETPQGRYLHVRVPIAEKLFPPMKLLHVARTGFAMELESSSASPAPQGGRGVGGPEGFRRR